MRIVYSYYVLDIVHRGHLKMMGKAVIGFWNWSKIRL